jgi:hypothetical protein
MRNIKLWRVFPWSLYFLSNPKSVMPFHSKRALLWRFNVAGTVKHTSVYAFSARNSSPILTKFSFYQQIFRRVYNVKLHGNPCSWSHTDTDGQTDITKFKGTFLRLWERAKKLVQACINLWNNIHTQGTTISLNLKNSIPILLGRMGCVFIYLG